MVSLDSLTQAISSRDIRVDPLLADLPPAYKGPLKMTRGVSIRLTSIVFKYKTEEYLSPLQCVKACRPEWLDKSQWSQLQHGVSENLLLIAACLLTDRARRSNVTSVPEREEQ